MMNLDFWDQFSKTGSVHDYLKYTACTLEYSAEQEIDISREGRNSGDNYTNRDSFSNDADR